MPKIISGTIGAFLTAVVLMTAGLVTEESVQAGASSRSTFVGRIESFTETQVQIRVEKKLIRVNRRAILPYFPIRPGQLVMVIADQPKT